MRKEVKIKYDTHCTFFETVNLNFNQKSPNDTLLSQFLPGNVQDNINTFDGNNIYCFLKLCNHERPGDAQSNPIHHSIKNSRVGKKNVKRHPKQNDFYGSLNF